MTHFTKHLTIAICLAILLANYSFAEDNTQIYTAVGKYGDYYHIKYTLTPENMLLTLKGYYKYGPSVYDFNDGCFQVFIPKNKFPIPAPNSKGYIILRMPSTTSYNPNKDKLIAEKRVLYDRIKEMKESGKGVITVVIELNPVIVIKNKEPLEVELEGANVFFREAYGKYIDYVGPLKETDRKSEIAQNDYMPMLYDGGWQSLTKQDVDRKMNEPVINPNTQKPFNFKMIDKEGKEVGRVNTPAEYVACGRKGNQIDTYTTYDIINQGLFEEVALSLFYFSKAKPSIHSYVRDFPFDKKDPLSILPVTFINWIGSDQHKTIEKAIEQGNSWREIAPNARVLKAQEDRLDIYDTFGEDFYSVPDNEKYDGNEASNVICPAVLGDLNGDGYEDIALSCAHYYVGGSGRFYYFVVLTRKASNEVLEDITNQVNETVF